MKFLKCKSSASVFGKFRGNVSEIRTVRAYFDIYKDDATSITDAQYNDLDIENLFNFSNRCLTPIGEMLLYHKFRHLSKSDSVATGEEIIARIDATPDFRKKIEDALSGLSDKMDYPASSLLSINIVLSRWHRYFGFLPMFYIPLAIILWSFTSPWVTLAYCLAIFIVNTIIHYWNKRYVETYIRPLVQLNKIRTASIKLSKIDRYNRLSEVEEAIEKVNTLSRKVSVFNLNKLLESDLMIVVFLILEIIKILLLIEPIMTYSISKKIGNVTFHAKRLIDYVGEWDVHYSVSSLKVWMKRNDCIWSIPSFAKPYENVCIDQMVHPLIPKCVPNTITIDRLIIITGSNMSGKSTFLKTIGVNIVASYAINTCFARRMELPECNLYTVLSVTDDLDNAKSYYFSEAERIKSIIDHCENTRPNSTNIVLIDEIFKGTNTIERISIANAVIKHITKLNHTYAVVSTHDIELARSFEGILTTCHFSEVMEQDKLRFDYKLNSGTEYTRNAISLLKYCGYPDEIIDVALRNTQQISKNIISNITL